MSDNFSTRSPKAKASRSMLPKGWGFDSKRWGLTIIVNVFATYCKTRQIHNEKIIEPLVRLSMSFEGSAIAGTVATNTIGDFDAEPEVAACIEKALAMLRKFRNEVGGRAA